MSKKIATIAYLKELYGKLGHTLSTTKENTYCPTYSEITQSKYYLNSTNNKNNYGLFIGSQYSVDDTADGKYADNQCVCEIDIMAIIPNGLNLSIIQSGTTNYGASGTVDCMVDYNELITSGTPYNDLPYIKVELKSKQYQKKDDGQEITSSITNTELSVNDSAIKYSGNAITGLTDNKSVSSHTYSLSATCKGLRSSIKIKQLGETYGYYASDNTWVPAIDYRDYIYSYEDNYANRITTGWLDDYGDNIGTTGGTNSGRDIYNTDKTDYRRGIEVKTNLKVDSDYDDQSSNSDSSEYGKPLPTVDTSSTYHIAFADDANSGKIGDSFHWLFKEENVSASYTGYCSGGDSRLQCSLEGSSNYNDYRFSSHRDYFKPQHCYGRTSIDRIYKKDISGNIRVDEDESKMFDKGFSENPIDHLQGQYPRHWRRQIATYRQNQNWDKLTADTGSMAKVTIYETGKSNEYKPSNRLVNGSYRVSSALTTTDYAEIYFPDNRDGNETYYAYPLFHYLSPENCIFDDDNKKTTYHRDSAHTLTNYEGGGSGKTYAYNMSIGMPEHPMIQDYGPYYLTYSDAMTYGNIYCPKTQANRAIAYIKEYTGSKVLNNVILYDDVYNYVNYTESSEPIRKNGFFTDYFIDYKNFTAVLPYEPSKDTTDTSYGDYDAQNPDKQKYTIILDDAKMPNSKEEWENLLNDNTKWLSSNYFFYGNKGNSIIKRVQDKATAPYQILSFSFRANSNVSAYIDGKLSDKATVSVDNSSKEVTVTINYGENFEGSAYEGELVITDYWEHNLHFPINYSESITMATARTLAANGYDAINDANNYWCTKEPGKGDKGKEFVNN